MTTRGEAFFVLVVEDDLDHTALIEAVFANRGSPGLIRFVETAEEAIEHLKGGGEPPDRDQYPLPDVIVLDLMMPGMGGIGFLEWLSELAPSTAEGRLQQIPVVVFTSSDDPEVIWRCHSLGAREVKRKPSDFGELVDVVHSMIYRWRPH